MLKLLVLAALLAAADPASGDCARIKDFQQTGATLTSVTLSWTLDPPELVPYLYTLHVNSILTVQFFNEGTNNYSVTGLQSCTQYAFDLTATCDGGDGETAYAYGSTEYETPGPVGALSVVGSVISWTAPSNLRCVEYYTVCYESTKTGDHKCYEGVISTSFDLGVLSACDDLDVTVFAVGGGISGEASTVHLTTEDGVPGNVRDLEVVPLTETSVLLAWNPPLENPACVQKYAVIVGPVENSTATAASHTIEASRTHNKEEEGPALGPSNQTLTDVLSPLVPCTDYRFGVVAVSHNGDTSDEEVVYLTTNGSAPGILPDVVFEPDEESITISWGDVSAVGCLDAIQICYYDPIDHTFACVEVPSSPNTWTLSGLVACREYEFGIAGMSHDGETGEVIVVTVPTKDRAPGPVQNLALDNVGVTSLSVTYDAPIDYPECVDQYVVTYKNILNVLETRSASPRAGSITTYIDGLDACAIYDVGVGAKSPTGIEGIVTHIRVTLSQATPDPPSGGQLVSSTETSLTVLWYAPTDTRFCVDTYEVRVSKDGSGPTQLVPILDFNQEVLKTFTDLEPCTSYMVQIRSRNSETSTWSPFATVLSDAKTQC